MKASDVRRFYTFMRKREDVRLAKEAGEPWPWTNDPILREYKFTNVKREHDRTSQRLREIYMANANAPEHIKLLNCAIFRYFGTYEFAMALGWSSRFQPARIKMLAKERLERGDRVFTGAYIVTNTGIKAPKYEVVTDVFLEGLWRNHGAVARDMVEKAKQQNSWRYLNQRLRHRAGFGGTGFMAKEVSLDFIMAGGFGGPPHDLDTWCPVGPGARRGVSRMYGSEDAKSLPGMNEHAYLDAVLRIYAHRGHYWPKGYIPLKLNDIQFQLCEFDKYERVRLGQGRPRSRYKPRT